MCVPKVLYMYGKECWKPMWKFQDNYKEEICIRFKVVKGVLFKFDTRQKNRFTKCYMILNTRDTFEENLKWGKYWESGTWKKVVLRKIRTIFLVVQLLSVFLHNCLSCLSKYKGSTVFLPDLIMRFSEAFP